MSNQITFMHRVYIEERQSASSRKIKRHIYIYIGPFIASRLLLDLFAGCSFPQNDMQMQWASKASLVFQGVTLRNSDRLVGRCRTSRAVHLSAEDLYHEAEVASTHSQLVLGTPAKSKASFRNSRIGDAEKFVSYVERIRMFEFDLHVSLHIIT